MARFFKSPDDLRKQLGLRCKALRKYRRVTQQELADLADVSARSLRRFENTGHAVGSLRPQQPGWLTSLDRLAWVGSRAIGALSYEPEHGDHSDEHVIDLHVLSEQAQQVVDDETPNALATLLPIPGTSLAP